MNSGGTNLELLQKTGTVSVDVDVATYVSKNLFLAVAKSESRAKTALSTIYRNRRRPGQLPGKRDSSDW